MTDFSPFNQHGQIDHNLITPEALASLSREQGEALVSLIDADLAVQAAEQRVADLRKRVIDLSVAHDKKLAELHAASPVINQARLIAETTAIQNGWRSPTPTLAELAKAHSDLQAKGRASDAALKKGTGDRDAHATLMADLKVARDKMDAENKRLAAKAAYDEAVELLSTARAEQISARDALVPARAAFSEALTRWQSFTRKLTQLDLARDMARRTAEAALAANRKNPQDGPRIWPLQRALSAKKEVSKSTRRNFARS